MNGLLPHEATWKSAELFLLSLSSTILTIIKVKRKHETICLLKVNSVEDQMYS